MQRAVEIEVGIMSDRGRGDDVKGEGGEKRKKRV